MDKTTSIVLTFVLATFAFAVPFASVGIQEAQALTINVPLPTLPVPLPHLPLPPCIDLLGLASVCT